MFRSQKLRWVATGVIAGSCVTLIATGALRSPTPAIAAPAPVPNDGKVRVIVFGAHPDDCEIRAGGVAAKWAARGDHVEFVSCTNGDIGHWQMAGGPLAQRRAAEVAHTAEILGIKSHVMENHDGELLPTLENRRTVTRLIREWNADIVISHRPNDYHPDHRYSGVLVQDAAYMVTVPFFCPESPYLTRNPVFMYAEDGFQKPNPFQPDVVVGIDEVVEKKLDAMDALESQFFEGGANGDPSYIPADAAGKENRKKQVRQGFRGRYQNTATRFRNQLEGWYGKDKAAGIKTAEAFEICEYGRRPGKDELKKLFPLE
jgi:LmbE family N-acetylglucosaminyl deacetylase